LDALHCQKKTENLIVAGGNDFLIQAKRNAKRVFEWVKQIEQNETPFDEYKESKLARGRLEKRHYKLYRTSTIVKPEGWETINQLIISVNSGIRKSGKTQEKKPTRTRTIT
jgi:hypothetical protein